MYASVFENARKRNNCPFPDGWLRMFVTCAWGVVFSRHGSGLPASKPTTITSAAHPSGRTYA
jgi:hypothetical protein